jgi:SEC-C motif-containing protein
MQFCPCSPHKLYLDCCFRFISKQYKPSTPEELMRSRYTAYYFGLIDYIAETMKSRAADNFNLNAARDWANSVKWLGLTVIASSQDVVTGTVEFKADYLAGNMQYTMHEVSEFRFENASWYYVDGTLKVDDSPSHDQGKKTGRNQPCPCGSQKKFKKCCALT